VKHPGRWIWLLLLIPITIGLTRLHFDVEVLNLLPDLPSVQGLKLYQKHFTNARELIVTVKGRDTEETETAARDIAERLRSETNLVASVTWQPPWLEHPGEAAELIACLWLNQPPKEIERLCDKLRREKLPSMLDAARADLATSLSPGDIARLSYDPFGFTRLPESVAGSAPAFGEGQELFSSEDGTFRILFVEATSNLDTYQECDRWISAIRKLAENRLEAKPPGDAPPTVEGGEGSPLPASPGSTTRLAYTGRPAFVAEIARGMEKDITLSIAGTAVIIAVLFWLAHRRIKPMLWLLTLLALTLGSTLALGGFVYGAINVISMGFAAILLGLAVDYAVVHYQEALAHPSLSVPQIRRVIAPSILWAAVTTIAAFLVLNLGGLPGLGQLGTLVGMGVALAAIIMVYEFLPPLFPDRNRANANLQPPESSPSEPWSPSRLRVAISLLSVLLVIALGGAILWSGLPKMDSTADPLRPRNSPAYAALAEVKKQMAGEREPSWLLFSGKSENEVSELLAETQATLSEAVSNGVLSGFTLPTALWPKPGFQQQNRAALLGLVGRRGEFHDAALDHGFAVGALGLTDAVLDSWAEAAARPPESVFWPTNRMSRWIFDRFVAKAPGEFFALGLLRGPTNANPNALLDLQRKLPPRGVWLSGWELMGKAIFSRVMSNLPYVLVPMIGLVLLSLWFAFRRLSEVLISAGVLCLSGFCLLVVMRLFNLSWNLLNLMSLPLILGTGVDYGIFMQLALRRHHGSWPAAYRSVGRALLLCAGTAIAGFGSLAFSGNAGMSSLGAICAVGIAANVLIALLLLPSVWWFVAGRHKLATAHPPTTPSSLYRAWIWRVGWFIVRFFPRPLCEVLARFGGLTYWLCAKHRRDVVIQNLLPVLDNDLPKARLMARKLFVQFALKLEDLWRFETGLSVDHLFGESTGWDHMIEAQAKKRGILLLTPHLGNWEFGAAWLQKRGVSLQVITMAEPGANFTELRAQSRARRNIDTLVIGNDPFAFLEVIRRLEAGATVALLMDRPPPQTAVTVRLFSKPFRATIAAAELARASGCTLLPVILPREGNAYAAKILAPLPYDRASLRDRKARELLTQAMVTAFEPVIARYADQWFHFVPIWPCADPKDNTP